MMLWAVWSLIYNFSMEFTCFAAGVNSAQVMIKIFLIHGDNLFSSESLALMEFPMEHE